MKKRILHVKFMIVDSVPEKYDSESDDGESVSEVFSELKAQMDQIDTMTRSLDSHVIGLYKRTKAESIDWMNEPLKPRRHIQKWCAKHDLNERPTMNEFMDACFDSASSADLESRVITFNKDDAAILWNGKRRLTVFDILGLIPTLFE